MDRGERPSLAADAKQELIPFAMLARRSRPVSGKGLVQDFQILDSRYIDPTPVRQASAVALPGNLVGKQA